MRMEVTRKVRTNKINANKLLLEKHKATYKSRSKQNYKLESSTHNSILVINSMFLEELAWIHL